MQPLPKLITLHAITFLHPGTGRTTGVVDLPVQREVHTGHPMFASSGLKGSLRDMAERLWDKHPEVVQLLFGSGVDPDNEKPGAGALSVTDARILAFPVRSLQQVFVWITCPMVIQRLLRDTALIGLKLTEPLSASAFDTLPEETAWVATGSPLQDMLILEDVNFNINAAGNQAVDATLNIIKPLLDAQTDFDSKRLVVIPNQDFQHLVRHATQISARIRLNERKTTDGDGGNLWYEETLPPGNPAVCIGVMPCAAQRKRRG